MQSYAGLAILAGQDTSLADVILRKVAFEDHVRASVRTASPAAGHRKLPADPRARSEEHTSELQSH